MNIEIEAKLKVESLEDIKCKLVELGAEFLEEKMQEDYYFDDENKTLATGDKCLRLRRESAAGKERFFLTYKGAREKDQFKKRQEIDIEIQDRDSMEMLLAALNYKRILIVKKKRSSWRYCDCIVALDELPLLGNFVEIEGPDDEKISRLQSQLALAHLLHIPKGYASLLSESLRTNQR
jgi:adenylate cyclase class 2